MTAQSTYIDQSRIDRAKSFLPANFIKLYRNATIDPYWLPDSRHFWYRHQTGAGQQFYRVDTETGAAARAFDHVALASALAQQGVADAPAENLPIDWLKFSAEHEHFEFKLAGQRWRYAPGNLVPIPSSNIPEAGLPSPDGRWALTQDSANLVLHNLETGASRALTTDGEPHHGYGIAPGSNLEPVTQQRSGRRPLPVAIWSPDSRSIISFHLDERHVREVHLTEARPSGGSAWPKDYSYRCTAPGDQNLATAELVVFETLSAERRNIDYRRLLITRDSPIERGVVWWCPDSKHVLFLDVERGDKSFDVVALDTTTGCTRKLWTESSPTYVEANTNWWDPIGFPLSGNRFLLISERDGWAHIYLHSSVDGQPIRQLTQGEWVVREVVRIDEGNGRVFFLASGREPSRDPYYLHLYEVNLDGTGFRLLTPEPAEHRILAPMRHPFLTWRGYPDFDAPTPESLSPDGRFVVDNFATLGTKPKTLIREVETGEVRGQVISDTEALDHSGWRWPTPFSVKSATAEYEIYGALWLPSDYDPRKRYPVIDSIYPGPQTIRTPKFSLQSAVWAAAGIAGPAALAELGFIVITVDGTGGPFRSKAFHDISYEKMERAGGLEDHIAAIRTLAQTYPAMDLDRVGIFGFSGGGTATARALFAYPDFFKAGVAAAGSHDLMGYTAYWGEKYHGLYDKERYDCANNALIAHNLKGKLLLIAGELDDNCHPAMTLQVGDALMRAGKDFELLIMTGHNHMTPGGSGYFNQRIWDFFTRHLLGERLPVDLRLKGTTDS